jgi:CO/xanthine dehydrogenase FAD-binding subunit
LSRVVCPAWSAPLTCVYSPSAKEATGLLKDKPAAAYIAGGAALLDLMKANLVEYPQLVDINPLPFKGIEQTADELRIGAIELISVVSEHPLVVQVFSAVSHHCCWPPRCNCIIWSAFEATC